MSVQARMDNTTTPLITSGFSYTKNGIIAQDGARATTLYGNTVMSYDATTKKWSPTGAQMWPHGIYVGDDIPAADLVAGDIEDCAILIGGCCTVDADMVVYDGNAIDEDTAIFGFFAVWAILSSYGIFIETGVAISGFEN